MKIALGCDHGALMLKNALIPFLQSMGHSVADFGTYSLESCDYPDFAAAAAQAVADGDCDRGIVLCTTGIGVSITANKIRGVRCALLSDINSARMARLHNDTNMMALGAAVVSQDLAFAIVETWLNTPFSNEDRHQRRIDKVMSCERGLKKKVRISKRRKRHTPLISKLLTAFISILLVLSLVLAPIATYVTNMADPSRLVDILFSSGIFGNTEDPTEGPTEEATGPEDSSEDATGPEGSSDDLTGDMTDESVDDTTNTDTPATGDNSDTNTESEDPAAQGGEPAVVTEENTDTPAADGEDTDTPADGENPDAPADGEDTDTPVDGENPDAPADGEGTDTPVDGENPDAPADGEDTNVSATKDLLNALQGMIGSDMMDEDTLHTLLEIPAETPIDTALLGEKLLKSDAAQALVSAYVSDAMDSAMGIEREPSLTSDTVMDIVTPHIGQLADIVEECLPEGTTIDRAALEDATLQALQTALPALVDGLPDVSEAASVLREQAPALGVALDALKFIRTGALRAAALLLVLIFIVILCLFRLPGLHGLRCVGICGTISALLCGGIYLLLTMPALHDLLISALGEYSALVAEFSLSFAHEFAVCGVIYGVVGLFLILSTTILRGFFGAIFDAIFSRD